jgi:hypothetical protein
LLIIAGDHVPIIPFWDVEGKTGAVVPEQKAGIGLNVGDVFGKTVKVPDILSLQFPPVVVMV